MSALDSHIDHILFTPSQIADRVSSLAAELTADLSSSSSSSPPPVFVVVATGGFVFAADLVRRVPIPVTVDFVRASSYGEGTVSSGEVRVTGELKVDVKGKHVILCPDYFVVGYGMDFAELYRNLPYIGVLKPEFYK